MELTHQEALYPLPGFTCACGFETSSELDLLTHTTRTQHNHEVLSPFIVSYVPEDLVYLGQSPVSRAES